jgi:ribosome-binding factor A
MPERRGGHRAGGGHRYPRTARVNEVLREIVAETLESAGGDDERLRLVTVTGVSTEADLRHATVFYSARHEEAPDALAEQRVRLQAAIGRQTRLKRTPLLSFVPDPAVSTGWRIEGILRDLAPEEQPGDAGG